MRSYLALFLFSLFYLSVPAKAEFPDSKQSVHADFVPESIIWGNRDDYPLDPLAMCDTIFGDSAIGVRLNQQETTGFVTNSPWGGPSKATAERNTVSLKLYCDTQHSHPDGGTYWIGSRYAYLPLKGYHDCPSSYYDGYDILGVAPYYSDKHCYKPLKCEAPFEAEGTFDGSGKLIVAQCKTYCPQGSNFNYDLGRCDIAKDETPQCEAQQHNPIDTSTGEKRQLFTDFTQNTSLPLSFTRSYGSLRATESEHERKQEVDWTYKNTYVQPSWYTTPQIGYYENAIAAKQGHVQWRHNYQMSLAKYSGENAIITLNDKTQRKFIYDTTDSTYSTPYPNGDSLKVITNGWQYIDRNQMYYHFNSAGQLISISNELNETLTLSYNVLGQLTSVTNNQNQVLSYLYNSDNLLSEVIQPDGNSIHFIYDVRYNLIESIYPDNTPLDLTDNPKEIYHYEDSEHPYALTGITDEKGVRYSTWQYNAIGQATQSSHALNTDTGTINYDNVSRKVSSTNSLGNTTEITFNSAGQVTKTDGETCSSLGEKGVKSLAYNGSGQQYFTTDVNGHFIRKEFSTSGIATGLLTKLENGWGVSDVQVTDIVYDINVPKPTQITHPNGLLENFTYGINGRLESHSLTADSETRTTTYGYNTEGLLASIDGSRTDVNDITSFTYLNGRLATVTNALNQTTTYENYDGFGNATKITDSNGVITQLTYDVRGRLTHINQAGRITQFDYDAIGQLIKTTEPSGGYLQYTYDDARRLIDITNNLGESIHYTLDTEGNITQQDIIGTDTNIYFTQQRVYDQINRLSQTISATNQVWENEYDVAGNLIKQITPANTELENTFDKLKRTTQQLDQADGATSYEYNKLDQLTKVTDALGRDTIYQYNKFGEVTSQTSQNSGVTTSTYDLAGNLASQTDARGVTATYQYDALNYVTLVTYSDNTANDTTFFYDNAEIGRYGIGQLTRVEKAFNSIDYYYNQYGELTKEIITVNRDAVNTYDIQTYITEYDYNADGQITSITYPSGRTVDYTYNAIGLVSQVTTSLNGTSEILASNIDYLPFGSLTSLTYGNGKTLTQTYNQNYQLTDNFVNGIINKTYAYDPVNNIDLITDNLNTNQTENFTYSNVDRLIQATGDYGDFSYNYDAIGNRLSKIEQVNSNTDTTNYLYQNNSQLTSLTGATALSMTYDAKGNLLSKDSDTFTYDNEARLNSATVNGVTTNYHYNYRGQRIAKHFENGELRYYVYDLQGLLIAELNDLEETQIEYVYLNGKRIAILTTSSATTSNTNEFYITNVESGLKLKASDSTNESLMVMASSTDETDWVRFTKVPSTNDYFYLQNIETGLYFRPVNKNDDAVIEQRPTSYSGNRTQWIEEAINDGQILLKNRWAQDYLQVQSGIFDENAIIKATSASSYSVWQLEPIEQTELVTQTYYVHTSHLDAPLAITDTNGSIVWQASYTPFGDVTITTDTLPESFTARFPGQYSDMTTGFYYNYFRDYDPELGRYIQSDPIGLAGGINTYGYVEGNPINYTDPLGLIRWEGTYRIRSAIAGAGGVIGEFDLKSECAEGFQATASILFTGPALGAGIKLAEMNGRIAFEDHQKDVNVGVFHGGAMMVSAGYQLLGIGQSIGKIRLGDAYQRPVAGDSDNFGLDFGAVLSVGSSTVTDSTYSYGKCECSK